MLREEQQPPPPPKSRSDRSELDDLLDEILGDRVFQSDFSHLCIPDEEVSNECVITSEQHPSSALHHKSRVGETHLAVIQRGLVVGEDDVPLQRSTASNNNWPATGKFNDSTTGYLFV